MKSLFDLSVAGKRVLIREDFNVPIQNGVISSDARLKAALPTITWAIGQGARVILLSHLGRPQEGQRDSALSLAPVAQRLSELLHHPVRFVDQWLDGVEVAPGEVVLCENVRFNKGEKANDPELAKRIAQLGDIVVMDAFATAHRAEASTEGMLHYGPEICAGPLLSAEVKALQQALSHPKKPLLALVGGSKVSTKLHVLMRISDIADSLMVGGGILNTFMAAAGLNVGQSLVETDLIETAKTILAKTTIPLPVDVVVAPYFGADAPATIKAVHEIDATDMILDIGPETSQAWAKLIQTAHTIIWNGPVGVFEWPAFAHGTQTLGQAIAQSSAFSIAGGGDTVAAIEQLGLSADISYISTAGGAFLEYVEGKPLPALRALGL